MDVAGRRPLVLGSPEGLAGKPAEPEGRWALAPACGPGPRLQRADWPAVSFMLIGCDMRKPSPRPW